MRRIIHRFVRRVARTVEALGPRRIVDLGCGEGIVARALSDLSISFEYLGIDSNPESIEAARRLLPNMRFETGDIVAGEVEAGWADLAMCIEVLEHLEDPRHAMRRIVEWTDRTAMVSVPWEPYFRIGNLLRGKYLRRLGNHPEHLQKFTPRSLRALLSEFSDDVRVETCFPWLIGTLTR